MAYSTAIIFPFKNTKGKEIRIDVFWSKDDLMSKYKFEEVIWKNTYIDYVKKVNKYALLEMIEHYRGDFTLKQLAEHLSSKDKAIIEIYEWESGLG